jgi:hypothetical protein
MRELVEPANPGKIVLDLQVCNRSKFKIENPALFCKITDHCHRQSFYQIIK